MIGEPAVSGTATTLPAVAIAGTPIKGDVVAIEDGTITCFCDSGGAPMAGEETVRFAEVIDHAVLKSGIV